MKKDFVIMTDAGCDLSKADREKYGIEVPPKSTIVWPDGTEKVADIDWENITPDEYYKLMSNKKNNFSTSIPSPMTIDERLTTYAKQGKDILIFTISSNMSGGYSAFTVVANSVKKEIPGVQIHVCDTRRYGPAIDLLAVLASLYRKAGHTFEETVEYVEQEKLKIHQCGVLDDLYFLARKGRISKTAAVMGSMIGIKPMGDLNNETGMTQVIYKAHGYQKFYKIFPKYVERTLGSSEGKVYVIGHSYRKEQAKQIEKMVREINNPEHLIMVELSQCTGANVGPGLAALFYLGDERVSPNCEQEAKIYSEITNSK